MYKYIYNIAMAFFQFGIIIATPFKEKARLRHRGERNVWRTLASKIEPNERYVWVHAASLGEFEQGREIIEAIKRQDPKQKILLTFFSPSGYEVRKNYTQADVICYLPVDTRLNAKRFLRTVPLEKVIWVKYEFWRNILFRLHRQGTPVYLVSAIFRPKQLFFKRWAPSYRRTLDYFTHIFVQDERSKNLLNSIGLQNVTIAGDTRFDRVTSIARNAKKLPIIEKFAQGNNKIIVAGSSWPKDEEILLRYFNHHNDVKLIIAPHEINQTRLYALCSHLQRPYTKYSEATDENVKDADCLIIDSFGLLSSVYQYGQVAYVGGGFGVGIHNTLEAAVWAMPVIFGPNYHKFKEAKDLIKCKAGFSISSYEEFEQIVNSLWGNGSAAKSAGEYVAKHAGATELIMKKLQINNE